MCRPDLGAPRRVLCVARALGRPLELLARSFSLSRSLSSLTKERIELLARSQQATYTGSSFSFPSLPLSLKCLFNSKSKCCSDTNQSIHPWLWKKQRKKAKKEKK
jgi:hypothetical protein